MVELSEKNRQFLISQFGEGWVERLGPFFASYDFQALYKSMMMNYRKAGLKVYPEERDLFTAYKLTQPKDVRVVIIGQDPYPDSNAHGLAFSCQHTISFSLKNIFFAIKRDLGINKYDYNQFNLTRWSNQGVFLLNTILQVGVLPGDRNTVVSLRDACRWNDLISITIEECVKENAIFLLWGNEAREYENYITDKGCIALCEIHPASIKHREGVNSWFCNHFKTVNSILYRRALESNNLESYKPIIW